MQQASNARRVDERDRSHVHANRLRAIRKDSVKRIDQLGAGSNVNLTGTPDLRTPGP
jgi:hypothetical protein